MKRFNIAHWTGSCGYDVAGTWVWTYDSESHRRLTEVTPFSQTVTYTYNTNTYNLASVSLDTTNKTEYLWSQGRLTNITSATGSFAYSYKASSDLLETITYLSGTVIVSRTYDNADRLTSISATNSAGIINSFTYTLDSVGRRTKRTDSDSSYIDYGYDNYDQLTSALKTNSANKAADAAYDYAYIYDEIGNRTREERGQLHHGGMFNSLNQLIHQVFTNKLDVYGIATGTNLPLTVKVNGDIAMLYDSTNFIGGVKLRPGTNTISIVTTDAETNRTEDVRTVNAPPTNPQHFTYDANGNLTADGFYVYTWNEENRLKEIETNTNYPSLTRRKSTFVYDGMGRRYQKTVYSDWNGSAYGSTNVTKYVWDSWLLLAELDDDNDVSSYNVWGLDLSSTLSGAGGVGGLLSVSVNSVVYLPCYDGNGNVTDIIATNGTSVAHYEYDPFGRTVAKNGTFADENTWQFSTKYLDESGLYYYGYRYYSPELGRWLSRDRINEKGGLHLYAFVLNNATDGIDPRGRKRLTLSYDMSSDLDWWDWVMKPIGQKWMNKMSQVLQDIQQAVQAEPCNCIESLTLAGHGSPGSLKLGDFDADTALIGIWQQLNDAYMELTGNPKMQPQQIFLQNISGYLCENNSSVEFVTCSSGALPEGAVLQTWLQQLLGPSVDIQLYESAVAYYFGVPIVCKSEKLK